MREMNYMKGNMKRVYHLPLDGFTDIFDELDFLECQEILDFQTQIRVEDDCCGPSSLPFWMSKSTSNIITYNQDGNHQEEENFIKKTIKRNPKSSYELSFRYIIDDDLTSFEFEENSYITKERDLLDKPKGNIKIPQMKKNLSRGQFQRMNPGVFQLKMFIPGSLRLKPKSRNPRKSSSSKSF